MHMPIGIMVKAKNSEDARGEIFTALDNLAGEHTPFDYYGDIMEVEKYSPEGGKGKELVEDRMIENKSEFMQNIKTIREAIEKYSNEELYEKDCNDMFRYYCYNVGAYRGPSCWLYDEWGSGLRTTKELNNSFDELVVGEKYYIVVVDVHC
jgi:hypothetical protein